MPVGAILMRTGLDRSAPGSSSGTTHRRASHHPPLCDVHQAPEGSPALLRRDPSNPGCCHARAPRGARLSSDRRGTVYRGSPAGSGHRPAWLGCILCSLSATLEAGPAHRGQRSNATIWSIGLTVALSFLQPFATRNAAPPLAISNRYSVSQQAISCPAVPTAS